jgi:hypothetical protein
MAPTMAYNCIDRVLREAKGYEACDPDAPLFGGVTVLFGGDLRQLAPIPMYCQSVAQIHFRNSSILQECTKISLVTNMRADKEEKEFADLLQRIGEGNHDKLDNYPDAYMKIPAEWMLRQQSLRALVDWTFEGKPTELGAKRAILAHTNEDCRRINTMVILIYYFFHLFNTNFALYSISCAGVE